MCAGFTFSDVFRGCMRPANIFFGGIAGGREIDGGCGGNGVGEGVLGA
jgi:hypothetical protein